MLTPMTSHTHHVDLCHPAGQVHLASVIRPGAELKVTALVVEREVSDVNVTDGLEDAARLPVYDALVGDDRAKLGVVTVDLLSSETRSRSHKSWWGGGGGVAMNVTFVGVQDLRRVFHNPLPLSHLRTAVV